MNTDFKEIIDKFIKINQKGYVLGINNNQINSVGLTLEHLLGKKADSMFFPDYYGIEVKCTSRFSRYNISLFSISFDGPNLFESNYLLEQYGTYDEDYKEKKKLIVNFKINEKVLVGKYYFELKIDDENEKLFINIYDLNFNLIEKRGYLSFDTLKKRIQIKLSKLALIFASKKKTDDNLFFRYYKIVCLTIKDFNTFLGLLKSSDVKACLMLRFSKSGVDILKNKNKNMCFSIKKKSIYKLFNEVFKYEN